MLPAGSGFWVFRLCFKTLEIGAVSSFVFRCGMFKLFCFPVAALWSLGFRVQSGFVLWFEV